MRDKDEQAGRQQPPEGKLIQDHREARDLSAEECGRRAGMSSRMWRRYERGWRNRDDGRWTRVRMSTETLVTMASIVELPATDLSICRPDAAAELMRKQATDDPTELARLLKKISDVFGEDAFDLALQMMDGLDLPPNTPAFRYHPSGEVNTS